MQTTSIRHDTRAWKTQVWISFFAAASVRDRPGLAAGAGPRPRVHGDGLRVLPVGRVRARQVRARQRAPPVDTPMWGIVVWGGFCLAMALTAWGLWRMEINPTYKAYLGVSWLFLISSAFTLAKTLRDAHEAAARRSRATAAMRAVRRD